MKKHINLWLVMFLAISLALPIYSMAQTLTLESYTTGDRISGAPIKSFYWGTDGNLVVYLSGPFTFSNLVTHISVDGTSGTYSGCTVSPPASITATPGANLTFRVFSTTANANLSMVVSPDPGNTKVNGAAPPLDSLPTPLSPSPLTISWDTTGVPPGPYLAVFQAQEGTQTPASQPPSQLVVAINISQQYKLTLTAGANGTVSPAGDSYYEPGTQASISATANSGYYFSGWSGDLSGTTAPTTILMNANKSVTATFTQTPATQYTVAVSAYPTTGGTVSQSGAGSYAAGASVTVTATPATASGYTFTNWTEGASVNPASNSPSYTFTISGSRSLVANFASTTTQQYTVSTSVYPSGAGTVSGAGTYNAGASVTVTATPSSTFSNWTEGATPVSTSASYTFTITGNRNLVANFAPSSSPSPPPPDAVLLPMNTRNQLSFGVGGPTTYICRVVGNQKVVIHMDILGTSNETNLKAEWYFPDGKKMWSGVAMGDAISGQMELRSRNYMGSNIPYDYIPAGDHQLKITAIGPSSVVLTVSYY